MSASRPFQGDTGEGMISRRSGPAVAAVGPKVGAARGRVPFAEQSYEILRDSAAARPFFFASAHGGPPCSAPLFPPRLVRSKSCAFFVSAPLFFRRSPALFSFGGRVALLCGVKCAVPRARVSRTRQPLFVFSLTASPTPCNALTICPLRVKALHIRLHLDRHFRTAAVAVGSRRNG